MVKKPRIGVTGNAKLWSPSWWCTALALRLTGAIPERISVRHTPSSENLDALIIGGGDDISPKHYNGEISELIKPDLKRDELEIRWIKKALAKGLPILGICRGAQLINVVLGGTLYQDIRSMRKRTYNRRGLLPTKQVWLTTNSQLAETCKRVHMRINSLHYQAIKTTGSDLEVVAWDLDNITQAVESPHKKIIATQWHPEYLFYLPSQFALFRWLANAARQTYFDAAEQR